MIGARRRGAASALAAAAAAAATALGAGIATAAAPNPSANIPLGRLPAACERSSAGAVCEAAAVAALDDARRQLGLGPYRLPAGFVAMAPSHQWLILANLDRGAYSLPPVAGIASVLDRIARQGAVARQDPYPWPLLKALHGQQLIGFSSNWAGGQPNALIAYYGWMYADGYGGGNVDCRTPSAAGCWGHRQNILAFPNAPALTMGAASLTRAASYALTIVETSTPPWPYAYRAPR